MSSVLRDRDCKYTERSLIGANRQFFWRPRQESFPEHTFYILASCWVESHSSWHDLANLFIYVEEQAAWHTTWHCTALSRMPRSIVSLMRGDLLKPFIWFRTIELLCFLPLCYYKIWPQDFRSETLLPNPKFLDSVVLALFPLQGYGHWWRGVTMGLAFHKAVSKTLSSGSSSMQRRLCFP